jgi:anti-anti-sigma factor
MDLTAEFCSIVIDASDDAVAVRVSGEIDLASAPLLDAAFGGLDGQGTIEVDVSEMTLCDGTGLRVLEEAHRRFGARLRVTGATPMLRRLADIVEMEWLSADGARPRHHYGDAPS